MEGDRTVLITGAGGQLGSSLLRLAPEHWTVLAVDRRDLDMTDLAGLAGFVERHRPQLVINCAAYTDVDAAESDEEACWLVNAQAPGVLARSTADLGGRIIQISTDYVFDGSNNEAYRENAPVSGLGVYGRSKAAGERAVMAEAPNAATILRTAWLYAPGRRNFVTTVLRMAGSGHPLRIVDDQVGQPTYAHDVAERIVSMVAAGVAPGIYHATNSGRTTWHGFATEILRLWGYDNAVEPIATSEFPRVAPRPAHSVLGHAGWRATGLPELRDWREALRAARRDHGDSFGPTE